MTFITAKCTHRHPHTSNSFGNVTKNLGVGLQHWPDAAWAPQEPRGVFLRSWISSASHQNPVPFLLGSMICSRLLCSQPLILTKPHAHIQGYCIILRFKPILKQKSVKMPWKCEFSFLLSATCVNTQIHAHECLLLKVFIYLNPLLPLSLQLAETQIFIVKWYSATCWHY